MTNTADRDYYEKRARDARALAQSAADPASARAHTDMAEHYERLLSGVASDKPYDDGSCDTNFTY